MKLILAVLLIISSASSVLADRYEDCKAWESAPNRGISGCTEIIERGMRESLEWRAAAYNNRGTVYDAKGEHFRAIADFDKAIALNPKFAIAYHNRGLTYAHKGEHDRAIRDYSRYFELGGNEAVAYRHRAEAYEKLGDKARADADYDKAQQLELAATGGHLPTAK